MKTYAPKGLHGAQLRALMTDLHASPLELSKFLQVTERSVWRWLKDDNAHYAVLAALWHETPVGRHTTALDVGNEATLYRGLSQSTAQALKAETARVGRLLAISDTGAANEPFMAGPLQLGGVAPLLVNPRLQAGKLANDKRRQDGPTDDDSGLLGDCAELG